MRSEELLRDAHSALRSLIDTVAATGGLVPVGFPSSGHLAPAVDPEWWDLGIAAQEALAVARDIEAYASAKGWGLTSAPELAISEPEEME